MSMEVFVFLLRERCPDQQQWQSAINDLLLPLKIDDHGNPLTFTGFLPVRFGDEEHGFEIFHDDPKFLQETASSQNNMTEKCDLALAFRWGGDLLDCACAYGAAAALIERAGAICYSPEDGTWYHSAKEVIAVMNSCIDESG